MGRVEEGALHRFEGRSACPSRIHEGDGVVQPAKHKYPAPFHVVVVQFERVAAVVGEEGRLLLAALALHRVRNYGGGLGCIPGIT